MQLAAVYFYFQLLSLIFALILLKKGDKVLWYFIPFLLITVIIELIGIWYTYKVIRNYWMYNIFTTFEYLFYSYLFYRHFRSDTFKKIARWFMPFYLLAVTLNLTFIQDGTKTFHTYTFLLGSFFIVVFCCFFLYESILPDQINHKLSMQPFFWICIGLLIFYLGSVIINALFEYLRSNDLQKEGIRIYGIINNSLNVILYCSFSIAFFLCRNNRKTYSSPS